MKWFRNILKGASLTAALFVFQACYGTPAAPPAEIPEEELAAADPQPQEVQQEEVKAEEADVTAE